MPNYLPATYQPTWGYNSIGQQMYPQYQTQMSGSMQQGLKWVDGEVGAKAYQMPTGWPANTPIALWDTNDTVIYLKSVNPMGMPNPLQKARYTLEGTKSGEATHAFSGDLATDETKYVRKEDMEQMKQELMDAINSVNSGEMTITRKTGVKGE